MNAPEGRLYRPLVLSVALFLMAAGTLLSIQMISAMVGPFNIGEIGEHDPRMAVALWRPARAAAGEAIRGAFGYGLVRSGRGVREVESVASLDPARVGAVVLSEPRALADADLAALEAYLDAGGGAVVMGWIAVHDAHGEWRGSAAMQRLLAAEIVEIDPSTRPVLVAARRGPLSAALDPRERIAVSPEAGTPGLRAADAELRWSGASDAPAAAIRREKGKGRLVWIAVPPERAMPGEWERGRMRDLVEAGVAWASRTPSVEMLPWPGGAPFAGTIEGAEGAGAAKPETEWKRALTAASQDAGLAELRVPRDLAARDALQPVLARALAEAESAHAWIATRKDLSRWLLTRAVVDARVRRAGPRRLVVEVTNRGEHEVEDLVLRIHLNEPARSARVEGTTLLQAEAAVRKAPDGESIDLVLPPLAARANAAWSVDLGSEATTVAQEGER